MYRSSLSNDMPAQTARAAQRDAHAPRQERAATREGLIRIPRDPKSVEPFSFGYRGFEFFCSAEPMRTGMYRPVVILRKGPPGAGAVALPPDTDEIGYATKQEALRHAEQQALRWAHDRTGTGQAQF